MWIDGYRRRVLVRPGWHALKRTLAEVQAERDALERELAATRQQLTALSAAVLERNRAYDDLRVLQRERAIVRARRAERDPGRPLH
jgi:hypothetical protein